MEVDGVFSGGGIKGLTFIGAFEVLEEKGIRFKRVAGTSAGSLMAALIAAGYTPKEIYQEIAHIDMTQFLDRRTTFIPIPLLKWLPIYWRLGLFKGQAFEKWIDSLLSKKGVRTFSDLPPGKLKVIVSDLTNGKIVVIPDDLHNYDIPFESFSVATAVRMSCSIPYFFEPVKLKTQKGNVIIVDGGVLSNFPMWLYDSENGTKKRPVIGLKLSRSYADTPPKKINNAIQLFEALFTTMLDAHDARYISKKHVKDIIFFPMEGILATEFNLNEEKKEALLKLGREKTNEFLKKWSY